MDVFVGVMLSIAYFAIGNFVAFLLTEDGNIWALIFWPIVVVLFVFVFIGKFTEELATRFRNHILKREAGENGDKSE